MSREQYQRAFVLQLSPAADPVSGALEGRIEHVASGKAGVFASLEELQAFVARVLEDQPEIEDLDSGDGIGPGDLTARG